MYLPPSLQLARQGASRLTLNWEETDRYTFANAPFAVPPTGLLRFAPPAPPSFNRPAIQDGKVDYYHHQAGFLGQFSISGMETGDCLFIAVTVPKAVLEGRAGRVPVLFW